MANEGAKKSGGRDMVLESRHVVGIFLGVAVLCGVFFSLGWVMGRTQQDSSVKAVATSNSAARPADKPAAAPAPSSWDFASGGDSKKPPSKLEATPSPSAGGGTTAVNPSTPIKPESAAKAPIKTAAPSKNALVKSPVIPKGHVVLQIAALTRESDALALVDALQKKSFPAFLLAPATGNLYRVQVGPYADGKAADAAKKALEHEGFKAITKR